MDNQGMDNSGSTVLLSSVMWASGYKVHCTDIQSMFVPF